ncbi:hypothetical protein C8J56DRAFT_1034276 [Mycena floridula]|nr:hypothetical protein C8J56DRAFT_1034276 [Mycena floridula]
MPQFRHQPDDRLNSGSHRRDFRDEMKSGIFCKSSGVFGRHKNFMHEALTLDNFAFGTFSRVEVLDPVLSGIPPPQVEHLTIEYPIPSIPSTCAISGMFKDPRAQDGKTRQDSSILYVHQRQFLAQSSV